jgi:hypothetical protein
MHALHDEARHSEEISLLRKLMQRIFVVRPPSMISSGESFQSFEVEELIGEEFAMEILVREPHQ